MSGILITGGSGTFGRAYARHLIEAGTDRICIYSRGEHAQADMRDTFGATDQERLRFFIGDVRDQARLRRAMEGIDIVVHAAALKRIEVGKYNPIEMVRTNIEGAINVIDAATAAGVKRVIMLSTDKAWRPVSPYGLSKALAESLFTAGNDVSGTMFTVVRYGNIAGSNGSVIPLWRKQLERGAPVHITDPDCTRFYMTIDQAVQLVHAAVRTGTGGDIITPQELPAYRLGDLLLAMGCTGARVTGLPDWEKLHEGMRDGMTSDTARRMSIDELKEALTHV